MDVKGQVSVEFLLLTLIGILLLSVITVPLIGESIDASNDVSWVSEASTAVSDITNAVNIIYANGPGAKRTLDLYVPHDMTFKTGNNTVVFIVPVSNGTLKSVNSSTDYALNNNSYSVSKGWHKFTVQWNQGQNYISITIT